MNKLQQLSESRHSIRAIFIDDGGVLNDNRLRGSEYLRLISEFMSAHLGKSPNQWADANSQVFPILWSEIQNQITEFANHRDYQHEYEIQWIARMCSLVGIPSPPQDTAIAITREVHLHAARHARTEVKGAADSVWKLFHGGYSLFAVSGTPSWELKEIFCRMGIHKAFSGLYGPDLVDHVKHGVEFYHRIFTAAGVSPTECLVIESSKQFCRWSIEAGAAAVWVNCEDKQAIALPKLVETLLKGD